eukprot:1161645-Pelagomonas_calceolata.AAC.8
MRDWERIARKSCDASVEELNLVLQVLARALSCITDLKQSAPAVIQVLARALACAPDPSKYACFPGRPTNFYCLFSNTTTMPDRCVCARAWCCVSLGGILARNWPVGRNAVMNRLFIG